VIQILELGTRREAGTADKHALGASYSDSRMMIHSEEAIKTAETK
jgi:hypothetical protein